MQSLLKPVTPQGFKRLLVMRTQEIMQEDRVSQLLISHFFFDYESAQYISRHMEKKKSGHALCL